MAAKVLDEAKHCECCSELMAAGTPFRWVEKQMKSGPKVGSYRTVYRPAHIDTYCGGKKHERKAAADRVQQILSHLALLRELNAPEHGVADMKNHYAVEFDKRYLAEFDKDEHASLRAQIFTA